MLEENLIKRLMVSVKCSVCGQHYAVEDIKVIGHREDLWFLRAVCSACQTQCLVAAVVKQEKVTKVITDLTKAELDKFKSAGRLTSDDLLDMHSFLKDFDGDFSRLFGQK